MPPQGGAVPGGGIKRRCETNPPCKTEIGKEGDERERSFLEPKKEPKKAVLSPLLLLDFPPTVVNAVHRSRAGSFAADLCAKRTGKSQKITEKQARLFYRKFSGFSYARELSLHLSSCRRKQVCFLLVVQSPVGVQRALSARKSIPWDGFQRKAGRKAPDRSPLAQSERARSARKMIQ